MTDATPQSGSCCTSSARVPDEYSSWLGWRVKRLNGKAIMTGGPALLHYSLTRGGMCEWLKQAVLKTAVRETVPGVRIPLPPPLHRSEIFPPYQLGYFARTFSYKGDVLRCFLW
jgi:hypothetical protein